MYVWNNNKEIAEFCAKWSNKTRHQLEKRLELNKKYNTSEFH